MSVKLDLEVLKKRQETILEQLTSIRSSLNDLNAKQEPIVQKVEALKIRTSSLAHTLLERTQKELDAVNQEMNLVLEKQANLERELKEIEDEISERENSTTLYIHEQANRMVSAFLDYVGEHMEDVGDKINKEFNILVIRKFYDDHYYSSRGCYVPTGDFAIATDVCGTITVDSGSIITKSIDFYFENAICTFETDEYGTLTYETTEWYNEYRKEFVSTILKTLEKNYNYGEFFNLTIGTSSFTLELV